MGIARLGKRNTKKMEKEFNYQSSIFIANAFS